MVEVIKNYLDNYAKENELFKNAYSKPGRTIEKCIAYIISQARKEEIVNNCAVVEDDKVFHWAREYYENENDITEPIIKQAQKVEVKTNVVVESKPKEKKPVKKEKIESNKISLFDF